MAVCLIFDVPGATQVQYEQVMNEASPGNRPPSGLISHVGGPTDNGWCVVEVWESQEAADRFFSDTLQRPLQKANVNPGQPRVFEVFNTMQP
jgi:hypothetical protein